MVTDRSWRALGENCYALDMSLTATILANGAGWQASDVRCCAGPDDAPFEEQHDRFCMAVVLEGTFGYRSSHGSSTLAPGAILLGNPGDCFECDHEHSVGDRCLSFHLDPDFYEGVLASMPGAKRLRLERPALPPDAKRVRLLVAADTARDAPGALEEIAYELAATVTADLTDALPKRSPPRRNAKRVQELAQWIEREVDEPLSLALLARHAGMSPYHLLREFKREIGITPHQFILLLRLRRAAGLLRHCTDSVLSIALASGFADLSEFTRRFRRLLGTTPGKFRARATSDGGAKPYR